MIDDDEIARLLKVARDAAAAEAARRHSVVQTEEILQEAVARFFEELGGIDLPTEANRRGYLIGIVWNVAAELVRQFVRRSMRLGLEADAGEVLELAVAAPTGRNPAEIEAIARRFFLDAGLDSKDLDLLLIVKLDRMGWRKAGEAAGLTTQQLEAARKRISRFLSDPTVHKRLLDVLGTDELEPPSHPLSST